MGDSRVDRWKKNGKVFVWRCGLSPSWNLSADRNGCESLLELLALMKIADWSSKAKILVDKSQTTANCDLEAISNAKTLTFFYRVGDQHRNICQLDSYKSELSLEFGSRILADLETAIKDVVEGKGDYSIGDESRLWVWWMVPNQSIQNQSDKK